MIMNITGRVDTDLEKVDNGAPHLKLNGNTMHSVKAIGMTRMASSIWMHWQKGPLRN
jgi:hypothetical protein